MTYIESKGDVKVGMTVVLVTGFPSAALGTRAVVKEIGPSGTVKLEAFDAVPDLGWAAGKSLNAMLGEVRRWVPALDTAVDQLTTAIADVSAMRGTPDDLIDRVAAIDPTQLATLAWEGGLTDC